MKKAPFEGEFQQAGEADEGKSDWGLTEMDVKKETRRSWVSG